MPLSYFFLQNNVKDVVSIYKLLTKPQKECFLRVLSTDYSVDHDRIYNVMNQCVSMFSYYVFTSLYSYDV